MAIVLKEPNAEACVAALEVDNEILMSAGTLTEALIVSARREIAGGMAGLIHRLDPDIIAVTSETARRIGEAYRQWGRGFHPAALNFGDCFAYELAKERACRLLYVGDDFAKTDVAGVL